MPTSRLQNRRLPGIGNRIHLAKQGRNRLEANPQFNIHAVGKSPLDSAGMICFRNNPPLGIGGKLIYHLRTAPTAPRKSHAELYALNCRD